MAIAKIEPLQKFDLGKPLDSLDQRHAEGKKLRNHVPREAHGEWKPGKSQRQARCYGPKGSAGLLRSHAGLHHAYGNQTEMDHDALLKAISRGAVKADTGSEDVG